MERDGVLEQREKLCAYEKTVRKYLPYVLIKCARYTNSKRLAEIIAICTFASVYRLTEQSGSSNKMPTAIESMLAIVGPDFTDRPGNPVGDKLFEEEGALRAARALSELDIGECLSRMDGIADGLDRSQLERITVTVMSCLGKGNGKMKNGH